MSDQTEIGLRNPTHPLPASPLPEFPAAELLTQLRDAIAGGTEFLFSVQRVPGHWCAELESNPTITAEYVLMTQMLGLDLGAKKARLEKFLRGEQNPDGGWGIAGRWKSDLSTATEAYLALRLLGVEAGDPALRRAEKYIRAEGGLAKVRVFTRIFLAMFGLFPWDAVPSIPPEFMLLPAFAPVNAYRLSSWARGTMVPLFVIFHHKPVYALPNGQSASNDYLDHLWLDPTDKMIPYAPSVVDLVKESGLGWRSFFGASDAFLKAYEPRRLGFLRRQAVKTCIQWVLDHQEPSGDWAGIFPPMLNGVIALTLEGYDLNSDPVKRGLAAIESFAWEDEPRGLRVQACNSPIWDTVLAVIGLLDSGVPGSDPRIRRALQWVADKQIRVEHGDWKVYRPNLISGGWSFEYHNTWYPDIDDTAAVLLAFLKADPDRLDSETVVRAIRWMLGMQNRDGGWAAFDVDNDKLFLNKIPFSDMDSLCDPSSPDVAGRVIEALGLWQQTLQARPRPALAGLQRQVEAACDLGVRYLRQSQEAAGSWFGRWGVNYLYGTSNVLCGLARVGVAADDPMVIRALHWLRECQNPDGGWGEGLESYADKATMGQGETTASQTAWALMGLLAYLAPNDPAIEGGARWLVDSQVAARAFAAWEGGADAAVAGGKTWDETAFTGTGFPNHFYLRYHYYRHYFPMMALGRYRQGLAS